MDLFKNYRPARRLCSSLMTLLEGPPMKISTRRCCFHYTAPKTWNNLPETVWSIETLRSFRRHLKKQLFELSFCIQPVFFSTSTNSLLHIVHNKFNLPTYLLGNSGLYKCFWCDRLFSLRYCSISCHKHDFILLNTTEAHQSVVTTYTCILGDPSIR